MQKQKTESEKDEKGVLLELANQIAIPNMKLRLNDPIDLLRPIVDNLALVKGISDPQGSRETREDQSTVRSRGARSRDEEKKTTAAAPTMEYLQSTGAARTLLLSTALEIPSASD